MLKGGNLISWWVDTLMLSVYEQRKDQDGFLYIVYTEESTLGVEEETDGGK